MLGYLFLFPIPNPWFESLFAAYIKLHKKTTEILVMWLRSL